MDDQGNQGTPFRLRRVSLQPDLSGNWQVEMALLEIASSLEQVQKGNFKGDQS
jgi:hypothetical protein